MGQVDTSGGRRRNKRWPEALKREIVAASLEPGGSVSMVARRYDVNANQVFSWRRRYGSATERQAVPPAPPTLLPVTITSEAAPAATSPPTLARSETIEIEVSGSYRIRVGASFDARALGRVLEVLHRAGDARERTR